MSSSDAVAIFDHEKKKGLPYVGNAIKHVRSLSFHVEYNYCVKIYCL